MVERSAAATSALEPDLDALRDRVLQAPDAHAERYRLARALFRAGDIEAAQVHLTRLAAQPDAKPAWLFSLGIAEVRLEHWDAAIAALERALEAEPDQPDWNSWLGRALVASGATGAGAERLERALALRPDRPGFAILLVRAYLQQERFDEALALTQAAAGKGDDPLWARLAAMADAVRAAEARVHALRGVQAFRAGAWSQAVEGLTAALALVPGQASWRVLLGRARLGLGDAAGAARDLQAVIEDEGPRAAWLVQLSAAQLRLDDRPGAIESLRRAVAEEPSGPAWRAKLAGLLLADGDAAGAVAEYRAALASSPDQTAWTVGLAKALIATGELTQACDVLAGLLRTGRAPPVWRMLLGSVELRLEEYGRAIETYRTAIDDVADEAPPAWRSRLAGLLIRQGDDASAAEALEAALAHPEATPAMAAVLARVYWRAGRGREALELIERAMLAEPDPPLAWRAMADEVRNCLASGEAASSATSPSFSDEVYRTSPAYAAPAEQSVYFPLWQVVAERVRASGAQRILDIGCGPGQFAEYLLRSVEGLAYTGVDFSPVAIEQARRRAPKGTFLQADLVSGQELASISYDLIMALEVLEHIDEDLAVLGRLRAGARFIGSVPSFDSFGHVRFFADAAAVKARYGLRIRGLEVEPHRLGPHSTLYLMTGEIA